MEKLNKMTNAYNNISKLNIWMKTKIMLKTFQILKQQKVLKHASCAL